MHIRAAVIGAIYKKSLSLSISSKQTMGVTNISTLVSVFHFHFHFLF